jgi:hypothetical protein
VPPKKLGRRTITFFPRNHGKPLALQLIVMAPILKLLANPAAHLHPIIQSYREITLIEKIVQI